MLITELKPKDELMSLVTGKTVIINCEGCREVHFPDEDAALLQKELGNVVVNITRDYMCNKENMCNQIERYMDKIKGAETVVVFSCGVGVQTVSEYLDGTKVLAGCDTYPLPGHQGITPLEYACDQCGECYLSFTGGICPLTACSKSLVNGQCGGAKEGKCEVDKEMECGWERIYRRLEKLKLLDTLKYPDVKVRSHDNNVATP